MWDCKAGSPFQGRSDRRRNQVSKSGKDRVMDFSKSRVLTVDRSNSRRGQEMLSLIQNRNKPYLLRVQSRDPEFKYGASFEIAEMKPKKKRLGDAGQSLLDMAREQKFSPLNASLSTAIAAVVETSKNLYRQIEAMRNRL